jgi:hypothetical protein
MANTFSTTSPSKENKRKKKKKTHGCKAQVKNPPPNNLGSRRIKPPISRSKLVFGRGGGKDYEKKG